jgi:hypothetical protein
MADSRCKRDLQKWRNPTQVAEAVQLGLPVLRSTRFALEFICAAWGQLRCKWFDDSRLQDEDYCPWNCAGLSFRTPRLRRLPVSARLWRLRDFQLRQSSPEPEVDISGLVPSAPQPNGSSWRGFGLWPAGTARQIENLPVCPFSIRGVLVRLAKSPVSKSSSICDRQHGSLTRELARPVPHLFGENRAGSGSQENPWDGLLTGRQTPLRYETRPGASSTGERPVWNQAPSWAVVRGLSCGSHPCGLRCRNAVCGAAILIFDNLVVDLSIQFWVAVSMRLWFGIGWVPLDQWHKQVFKTLSWFATRKVRGTDF